MATVRVDGADRLAGGLRRAGAQLTDTAATGAVAGRHVLARATGTAPRRTGRLAASHTVTTSGGDVVVGNTARYARPVHSGGQGRPPRPWLRDALDATTGTVVDEYTDHVRRAVDRIT